MDWGFTRVLEKKRRDEGEGSQLGFIRAVPTVVWNISSVKRWGAS